MNDITFIKNNYFISMIFFQIIRFSIILFDSHNFLQIFIFGKFILYIIKKNNLLIIIYTHLTEKIITTLEFI